MSLVLHAHTMKTVFIYTVKDYSLLVDSDDGAPCCVAHTY